MLEFVYDGEKRKLSAVISLRYPMLGYGRLRMLLKNKDVSVDGKRIKEDIFIEKGASVRLYTALPPKIYDIPTVYEDDNLFIFNKPKGIETQGEYSVEDYARSICPDARAVHRLDMNTDGVIIVAKNERSEQALIRAIKERKINKSYLAVVYGRTKEKDSVSAYLKKDENKAKVKIFDKRVDGSVSIVTNYRTVFYGKDFSVVDIDLITGRTHQIRAQFAYLGHQVLGDGKYGREEINSRFQYKKQALCAYKLTFETDGYLAYLNGKSFEIDTPIKDFIR